MKWQRFLAVFHARSTEFLRDSAALSWNIIFPFIVVPGFVYYLKNGVLKRLKAAPLYSLESLAAQLCSRLWLILAVLIVIYSGCICLLISS